MKKHEVMTLSKEIIERMKKQRAEELAKLSLLLDDIGYVNFLEAFESVLLTNMASSLSEEGRNHIRLVGLTLNNLIAWHHGFDEDIPPDVILTEVRVPHCPTCKSFNIQVHGFLESDKFYVSSYVCKDCSLTWRDSK